MLKTLFLLTSLVFARPEMEDSPIQQVTQRQINIANHYSKILTGMEILDPKDPTLQSAILLIETDPNLFIDLMFLQPSFFDIRVANFVSRLSNEDAEPYESIDDYQVALAIAIRDNLDFRSIFNRPFFIQGRDGNSQGNRGIEELATAGELSNVFTGMKLNFNDKAGVGQTVRGGYMHDGLMSSQGFGMRFISNGTNRRPVRAVYDMYLCSKIESYMDASLNDMFVGPDISRNPGDNPHEYQNKCSGCHAVLDGQRGAFANYDEDGGGRIQRYTEIISKKYNRNQRNNPDGEGYLTLDTYWQNPLIRPQDQEKFGWRTPISGFGVLGFANMIVQSEQFQRCMTKKVIAEFCERNPYFIRTSNKEFISISESFRTDGYKIKNLISKVTTSSYCR